MTMTTREFLYRLQMPLREPIPDTFTGHMGGDGPGEVDLRPLLARNGAERPVVEPRTVSVAEMLARDEQPLTWAVEGLLADGVTLLAGSPKLGKSWLGMELVLAVAEGKPFLSLPTSAGQALYLALEDGERRLRRRLPFLMGRRRTGAAARNVEFATRWPGLDTGGIDSLRHWCDRHKRARVIVIDTWGKFAPGGMFTYMSDLDTIGQVKDLAEERAIPVVLIHHVTKSFSGSAKSGADPLSGIAGSTGLIGSVDGVLMLTRPRGAEGGRLYVTGRDVQESSTDLTFDLGNGVWKPVTSWGVSDAD